MLTWMEEPTDSAGACSVSYLEGQFVWSYEMVMTSWQCSCVVQDDQCAPNPL